MRILCTRLWTFALFFVLFAGSLPQPASAQLNLDFTKPLGGSGSRAKVALSAQFTLPQAEQPGVLSITAKIPPRYHIYSLTQQGPPQKTIIKLTTSGQYQLTGGFEADHLPKYHFEEKIWPGVRIEEHEGTVTFYAPLKLAPGVNPEELVITGELDMQLCSSSCEDVTEPFTARLSEQVVIPPAAFATEANPVETAGSTEYRRANSAVIWQGVLEPSQVTPGSKAFLKLTATPDPDWHIYTYAPTAPAEVIPGAGMATLIALTNTSGLTTYQATTPVEVTEKKTVLGDINRYHNGPVTWTVEIDVPASIPAGKYPLEGLIGYQVCTESSCQQPMGTQFKTELKVGSAEAATPAAVTFSNAEYDEAANASAGYRPLMAAAAPGFDLAGLLWVLPTAFLGGLILNLMPCVLPVVGLKILSLVEQAGHNRREAMQLNLAFTSGVLAVFMALATMAVALNLSWGEQFQSPTFNIVLTAVLFVFALSFLGVWEIPLPGFVGSGSATKAAAKEGYAGAFFKGALSTVLATPCSGPALGAVFALTLTMPPAASYLLFLTIGLGMSSPYLLVGAFPALVRWLPKPGAWMDTFKQITGFIMLGAVVVMFKFFVKDAYVVPAFGLLIGLWFGCWWIGRTPLYEARPKVFRAWAIGIMLAIVCGVGGFRLLMPRDSVLPWKPFSTERLAELRGDGKVVLVDFTAKWCLTCQLNYVNAIDTEKVRETLEAHGAVPLLADWTDKSEEIKRVLNSLDSNSIPLLAIYPADPNKQPIILRDLVSQGQVLEKIQEASGKGGAEQAKAKEQERDDSTVNWQPYSPGRVEKLREVGRPVLVSFTANWDPAALQNHRNLSANPNLYKRMAERGIAKLVSDGMESSPDVKRLRQELGANSGPVVAIYPADREQAPIVVRGLLSERQVVDAIDQAERLPFKSPLTASAAMK